MKNKGFRKPLNTNPACEIYKHMDGARAGCTNEMISPYCKRTPAFGVMDHVTFVYF